MKPLKSFLLISLIALIPFILSLVGKNSESIIHISYTSYSGDKGGNFFDLQINQDSTALITGDRWLRKTYKTLTKKSVWEILTKLNLKEFNKIHSSVSTTRHDGTDTCISIYTNIQFYSVLNGNIRDSKEIHLFVNSLDTEIGRILNEFEN
jgi:hypothetical protein